MKQLSVEIVKKNRKYFAIKMQNGFECKLLIDENSEKLEIGKQDLMLDDISIRTKYGTDVIYKMSGAEKSSGKIITLSHEYYNSDLVDQCKKLGGKWDGEIKSWVFDMIVADKVEELDMLYNDNVVTVEIIAKEDLSKCQDSVKFCGYTLSKAKGRDSGAILGDGIAMINGNISSGGSVKNWRSLISAGSTFRLKISKNLLDKYEDGDFEVKILNQ
jgi:hypothetical protein